MIDVFAMIVSVGGIGMVIVTLRMIYKDLQRGKPASTRDDEPVPTKED